MSMMSRGKTRAGEHGAESGWEREQLATSPWPQIAAPLCCFARAWYVIRGSAHPLGVVPAWGWRGVGSRLAAWSPWLNHGYKSLDCKAARLKVVQCSDCSAECSTRQGGKEEPQPSGSQESDGEECDEREAAQAQGRPEADAESRSSKRCVWTRTLARRARGRFRPASRAPTASSSTTCPATLEANTQCRSPSRCHLHPKPKA